MHQRAGLILFQNQFCRFTIADRLKAGDPHILEIIAVILVALWVLGLFSACTTEGRVHSLLIIAVVVLLVRVFQGRRVL